MADAVPAEVLAVWGEDALRCDCGPAFDKNGKPRSTATWHHRKFHLPADAVQEWTEHYEGAET